MGYSSTPDRPYQLWNRSACSWLDTCSCLAASLGRSSRDVKLTTHVHAVSSFSIKCSRPPLPDTPSRTAQGVFLYPWRNWLLHQIRFLPAQKAYMNFNCIMLKLVIDDSFTFKLFWPLIVNWQNRFSLSLCDESAGCGFRYFSPPASYQNILMNFTRYRLRHLSFCRCVSGNMSTPISSTENTLLSAPHPPAHTTTSRLQCTQINMSNLLKDRPKIVSSVFLRDYESGELEINAMQTDGCHNVCLPFTPDNPMCSYIVVWGDISMSLQFI